MRKMTRIILGALVLGAVSAPSWVVAAPLEEVVSAQRQGDFETALRILRPLADQGDAGAQFGMANLYANGQGVPADPAAAVELYRKSAGQGYAAAQYVLGLLHAYGRGVPLDYAEAARWYRLAGEQGIADAQNNLGTLHEFGRGVPQDDAEAVAWYRRAADQGNDLGQLNLGAMLARGRGAPRDYVTAHMLFSLAASHLPPGRSHDDAIHNRDLAASKLSPAQVATAQKLASDWKPLN
jgi:TPR repeat protein